MLKTVYFELIGIHRMEGLYSQKPFPKLRILTLEKILRGKPSDLPYKCPVTGVTGSPRCGSFQTLIGTDAGSKMNLLPAQ